MPDDYYTKEDFADDPDLDDSQFDQLPSEETLEETISNIEERNVAVHLFESGEETRDHLAGQIPKGATVMDGHSTTMNQIGFQDVLEAAEGFEYIGNRIAEIDDEQDRFEERRTAVTADIFFDGVNAIAETGELLAANALGNGVGAWPIGAKQLILVSGTSKIMPSWDDAVERVREYALPLEDARAREVYGQGSVVGKLMSLEYEQIDDRTQLVLINDRLGF